MPLSLVELEMSRIVVVACRVGVDGAPNPILKRAFVGAGSPGRSEWPGRGMVSATMGIVFISASEVGLNVRWSVCGREFDSGREE